MDVNRALLQIPSPTAAPPSEGAASRPQEVKPPSAGKAKKSFASTLRTAQEREDNGRLQQSNDMESRRATKVDTEIDQVNSSGEDAPRPGEIKGRGLDAEGDRPSQSTRTESGGAERKEGWAAQTQVSAALAEVVRVLGQTEPLQNARAQGTDLPQSMVEEDLLASSQEDGIAGAPALAESLSPETGVLVAISATTDPVPALPQAAVVPVAQPSQTASAVRPTPETHEALSGPPLDPPLEPAVKAVDQKAGGQRGTLAQQSQNENQAAPAQPAPEGGKQGSAVSQELFRLDAAGPQLARVVEQPAPEKQAEAPAHPHRASHSPLPSSDAGSEERAGQSMAIEPHGLRAGSDSGQHSDGLWSDQNEEIGRAHV